MPQGRRRHKKESAGFKPWQRNRVEWDEDERSSRVVLAAQHHPRRSVEVEPAPAFTAANPKYRASLQLLVPQVKPRLADWGPVRINGFKHKGRRVSRGEVERVACIEGGEHFFRSVQCTHADGETVVLRKCRDCEEEQLWISDPPRAEPEPYVSTCVACGIEAVDGGDFCAFHECLPDNPATTSRSRQSGKRRPDESMSITDAPGMQEKIYACHFRAFQILGGVEMDGMTNETLKYLRGQLIEKVTNGGNFDWNPAPEYGQRKMGYFNEKAYVQPK